MGMGVVSDNDFDAELTRNQPTNIAKPSIPPPSIQDDLPQTLITPSEIVDAPKLGRGEGNVEVPNPLRQMIGEEAAINGREAGLALAKQFGISPSSVSAYTKGATSTSTYNDTPNLPHILASKSRTSKRARSKMMAAMAHITPDKLANAKVGELATVAKMMSSIVKDMEPPTPVNPEGPTQNNQFNFYAPHFRSEESYEVVVARE